MEERESISGTSIRLAMYSGVIGFVLGAVFFSAQEQCSRAMPEKESFRDPPKVILKSAPQINFN